MTDERMSICHIKALSGSIMRWNRLSVFMLHSDDKYKPSELLKRINFKYSIVCLKTRFTIILSLYSTDGPSQEETPQFLTADRPPHCHLLITILTSSEQYCVCNRSKRFKLHHWLAHLTLFHSLNNLTTMSPELTDFWSPTHNWTYFGYANLNLSSNWIIKNSHM